MPKKPTPGEQLEFAQLRAFVATSFEDCAGMSLPAETAPAAVADRMWARSPGLALRGLRAAAADAVEMLKDLEGPGLAAFEARLAQAGAPSFSAMRDRSRNDIFRILHRGRIQNDEECRRIIGVLSDVDDSVLDRPMRELANRLLYEYEQRSPSQRS